VPSFRDITHESGVVSWDSITRYSKSSPKSLTLGTGATSLDARAARDDRPDTLMQERVRIRGVAW
jgi:hypothetical protein